MDAGAGACHFDGVAVGGGVNRGLESGSIDSGKDGDAVIGGGATIGGTGRHHWGTGSVDPCAVLGADYKKQHANPQRRQRQGKAQSRETRTEASHGESSLIRLNRGIDDCRECNWVDKAIGPMAVELVAGEQGRPGGCSVRQGGTGFYLPGRGPGEFLECDLALPLPERLL